MVGECQVSDSELGWFCDMIRRRFAIDIQKHQKNTLCSYLLILMDKTDSQNVEVLINKLDQLADDDLVMIDICQKITVDESYFFRDEKQMQLLQFHLLPELIRQCRIDNRLHIKIWSAGCSNGQELYTILIMLKELLPDFDKWTIEAIGTDINHVALKAAKIGCYNAYSFRGNYKNIVDQYFDEDNGKYTIHEFFREKVEFFYLNLNDKTYKNSKIVKADFDLILCRNVFIYFDHINTERILTQCASLLKRDGVILLGPSDFINGQLPGLSMLWVHNSVYYKRSKDGLNNKKYDDSVVELNKISNYCDAEEELLICSDHDQAKKVLLGALKLTIDEKVSLANEMANVGEYALARDLVLDCLKEDKLNAQAYYVNGLIDLSDGEIVNAKHSFKKALFLSPEFIEAYYQLGLILMRDDRRLGLKHISEAVLLAKSKDPNQPLSYFQGESMASFICHVSDEIQFFKSHLGAEHARTKRD